MREVASVCPGCGRRSYVAVDAWAGSPDAARDGVCGLCRRGRGGESRRGGLGPVLLLFGLVGAPVVAALEIALR